MSFKKDIEFLFEIGTLRNVMRSWDQFFDKDLANVTEHTYRVMWIALILAKREKIEDTAKIIKMALVHDLGEIRAPEVNYVSRLYADVHEDRAREDTLRNTSVAEEFQSIIQEYFARETLESRIVKDADNLDVDLELVEKAYQGNKIAELFQQQRIPVLKDKLFTNSAKEMFDEIVISKPYDWHANGINRFNSGDWKKTQE